MLGDFDLLDLLAERSTVTVILVRTVSIGLWRLVALRPSSHSDEETADQPFICSSSSFSSSSSRCAGGSDVHGECIPCAVFTGDSDLLGALRHLCGIVWLTKGVVAFAGNPNVNTSRWSFQKSSAVSWRRMLPSCRITDSQWRSFTLDGVAHQYFMAALQHRRLCEEGCDHER